MGIWWLPLYYSPCKKWLQNALESELCLSGPSWIEQTRADLCQKKWRSTRSILRRHSCFCAWYKGDKDNQVDTQCCLGSADMNDQRQTLDELIWCWMRWRKRTMFSQHHTNSVPQVRCHTNYNLPCVQKKAPFVWKTVHGQTHSNKKTQAIELEQNFRKTGRCK